MSRHVSVSAQPPIVVRSQAASRQARIHIQDTPNYAKRLKPAGPSFMLVPTTIPSTVAGTGNLEYWVLLSFGEPSCWDEGHYHDNSAFGSPRMHLNQMNKGWIVPGPASMYLQMHHQPALL